MLYMSLVDLPLGAVRERAREAFPVKASVPDWTLAISYTQRRTINLTRNEELHTGTDDLGLWVLPEQQSDIQ